MRSYIAIIACVTTACSTAAPRYSFDAGAAVDSRIVDSSSVDATDSSDTSDDVDTGVAYCEVCHLYTGCKTCLHTCDTGDFVKCNKCIDKFVTCAVANYEQEINLPCACLCQQQLFEEIVECYADAGYTANCTDYAPFISQENACLEDCCGG